MFTEKQKVLADAPEALNKPDQPWEATVEGNFIVSHLHCVYSPNAH